MSAALGSSHAQDEDAAATPPYTLDRSVSVREVITDNHRLSADKEADAITELSVGARGARHVGRLRGYFDYTLSGLLYARHSDRNRAQHSLNAFGTGELLDDRAFVDLQATVSREALSAFGVTPTDPALDTGETTDVTTLRVSPYLRGPLPGGDARYEARLSYLTSHAGEGSRSDFTARSGLLHLDGGHPLALLAWSLDATRQVIDYERGREAEDDRLTGTLSARVTSTLRLGVIAGVESTNFASVEKETHRNWGGTARWTPSPRTALDAQYQRRFFGDSHNVVFTYRTARTTWAISDRRDVFTGRDPGFGVIGTTYDLFFRQLESIEPDPVRRDALVRQFLFLNNIDPTAEVVGGFLTDRLSLQRMQTVSFAWRGRRQALVVHAARGRTSRLDTVTTAFDDLAQSQVIQQRNLLVDVSHRLTPLSTATLTANWQRTRGLIDRRSTLLRSLTAAWQTRLGPHTDFSAGARYSNADSTVRPYTERAVFARMRLTF